MINWKYIINKEKKNKYFKKLLLFLKHEYKHKKIFPKKNHIFNAFKLTKFEKLKVVIIGQDPYYNKKQAHGLAFSVRSNIKNIPPSIQNIYKEIKKEYPKYNIPKNGCLKNWAKQDILLLNSILTVEEKKPKSHKNQGWEIFTNKIICYINKYLKNIVFLLWGYNAQKKTLLINNKKHLILKTSHPSPLSVNKGFNGCNHFKKTNLFLQKINKKKIIW